MCYWPCCHRQTLWKLRLDGTVLWQNTYFEDGSVTALIPFYAYGASIGGVDGNFNVYVGGRSDTFLFTNLATSQPPMSVLKSYTSSGVLRWRYYSPRNATGATLLTSPGTRFFTDPIYSMKVAKDNGDVAALISAQSFDFKYPFIVVDGETGVEKKYIPDLRTHVLNSALVKGITNFLRYVEFSPDFSPSSVVGISNTRIAIGFAATAQDSFIAILNRTTLAVENAIFAPVVGLATGLVVQGCALEPEGSPPNSLIFAFRKWKFEIPNNPGNTTGRPWLYHTDLTYPVQFGTSGSISYISSWQVQMNHISSGGSGGLFGVQYDPHNGTAWASGRSTFFPFNVSTEGINLSDGTHYSSQTITSAGITVPSPFGNNNLAAHGPRLMLCPGAPQPINIQAWRRFVGSRVDGQQFSVGIFHIDESSNIYLTSAIELSLFDIKDTLAAIAAFPNLISAQSALTSSITFSP